MSKKIDPYCKKFPGAFIEFTGLVTPCCWFITTKERHDLLESYMGDEYKNLFITSERKYIVRAYKKIEDSWETDTPYPTCVETCGTHLDSHPLQRKFDV